MYAKSTNKLSTRSRALWPNYKKKLTPSILGMPNPSDQMVKKSHGPKTNGGIRGFHIVKPSY